MAGAKSARESRDGQEPQQQTQAQASSSSSSSSSFVSKPATALAKQELAPGDDLDKAIAECSESSATASGKPEGRLRAIDDPELAVPKQSRADWKAEVQQIRAMVVDQTISDEKKLELLHEALQQRIDDTRAHDEVKVLALKRLEATSAERDRCQGEIQRTSVYKQKLEACCREQKEHMDSLSEENQRLAEEERSRHTELKEKFQQAIKDVQEKMDAELEVREHFLKENDDLRIKLQKFNETYEAQERQLAEQQEAREKEMQAAQQRLHEHEVMSVSSKANATQLEKQNETLRKTQKVLQDELQSILNKFDEFSKAVSGSNQHHSECKEEIDTLQAKMELLEKENLDLRGNARLAEMNSEQQIAQKQRDALEKLCDNLQKENRTLRKQLGRE
eukprot:TRINITY_DN89889_c0_g1_i1.p1 TRINITY_DN89889_c0_g1~~TRINITY_DN89889_c0_g1_i1.p1  ORF type:complete len:392 (+),score=116.14 TRINITY_DN89889_c0_g1_i1:63-1238(+)